MLARLGEAGEAAYYKKGGYIFRDKFHVPSVFILLEGKAAICKNSASGGQRTIFILDAPTLLNEPGGQNLAPSADCVAFNNCKVLAVDTKAFFDLMAGDFELTKVVIDQITHKTRRMYRQLKNTMSTTKAEKRLAAKLWKLCRDYGKPAGTGTRIDIELTNASLADLIGIRRETVSRALKTLQDEGLIVYKKREIIVLNTDELSKYFKSM